jgi:NADP-dependent 3-hydroxy acid dehydrogenase YdfG
MMPKGQGCAIDGDAGSTGGAVARAFGTAGAKLVLTGRQLAPLKVV